MAIAFRCAQTCRRNLKKTLRPAHFLILAGLFFFLACAPAKETTEDRIQRLGGELRCPVCRGVPISESPAALAKEMMDTLKEQAEKGKSDEEILKFFEERYGEWVLLKPKPEGMNLMVWILPALALVGGAVFIITWVKKGKI
ncbi:MAG: cytochrome c-type biogenesis protein CcmH [Deltaproteobacteria bacterium]|nr:cytochrome c-type biogenesis protein CcmH [Deltaproteobacteria bacterium]